MGLDTGKSRHGDQSGLRQRRLNTPQHSGARDDYNTSKGYPLQCACESATFGRKLCPLNASATGLE
jgi:hypothetical protein